MMEKQLDIVIMLYITSYTYYRSLNFNDYVEHYA